MSASGGSPVPMWLLVLVTLLACVGGAALGAWIAMAVHDAEAAPAPSTPRPARPAQRKATAPPPAVFGGAAGTGLIARRCATHPEAAAEWTCRFCKREHCARCRTTIGEYAVCPSATCQESARNFGGKG